MNNSWWQELMHFFLQGMTLKQLIHMLIILIILIIVMPVSVKEWINLHNPEILPHYWMYYILLFCVSYVLNGVVNSAYHAVTERIEIFAAQKRKSKEEKYVQDLFDSLTLGERAYLAFAVAANNQLKTEKGSPEAISLLEKGFLFGYLLLLDILKSTVLLSRNAIEMSATLGLLGRKTVLWMNLSLRISMAKQVISKLIYHLAVSCFDFR